MTKEINDYDSGLIAFAIPNFVGKPREQIKATASYLQKHIRIDHFKFALPNARFVARGVQPHLRADICGNLHAAQYSMFGEPDSHFYSMPFNNDDWHFTSGALRLRQKSYFKNDQDQLDENSIHIVDAPLSLDMNLTRYCAHQLTDGEFVLPDYLETAPAHELLRKQRARSNHLRTLTLDDNDNILAGERYTGARFHLACLRSYLGKTTELLRTIFNQPSDPTFISAAQSQDRLRDHLGEDARFGFVSEEDFKIYGAELYVDFQCPDAVATAKQLGKILKRLGRKYRGDEYPDSKRPHYTIRSAGHCLSHKIMLNSNRTLKLYAKTATRLRVEVCLEGSLRNHVRGVKNLNSLDSAVVLFKRAIEIAATDIANLMHKAAQHQTNLFYGHRLSPLAMTQFISAIYRAAGHNQVHIQKLFAELLEFNSARSGDDESYNAFLTALERNHVLVRTGLENRVMHPAYILTDAYQNIVVHLLEPSKKLRLAKPVPSIPTLQINEE